MKDLRCMIGLHKHTDIQMEVDDDCRCSFWGPRATFRWTCARCGKRGVT